MLNRLLSRCTGARQDELAPSLTAAACFFCILFAAFMLRPLRESMALSSTDDSAILAAIYHTLSLDREIIKPLYLLYLGTLCLTIFANIPYSALVARVSRATTVKVLFRFAMLCIAAFVIAPKFLPEAWRPDLAVLFFIWFSVFNVLTASAFWQLMADTHRFEDSKRLFGFIAIGGTLGAIAGSAYAWEFASIIRHSALGEQAVPIVLMCSAILLLEAAAQLAKRISKSKPAPHHAERTPIGGSALAGLIDLARSPYLLAITAYLLIFTVGSTFLWFEKMRIVEATVSGQTDQTRIFAAIELVAQTATIILQLALTSRIIRILGVGKTLTIAPLITVLGFISLAVAPILLVYTAFEATRKAANYALAKPARETLFTVIPREDKYKAKALIDTFVYRAGDVLGVAAHLAIVALAATLATDAPTKAVSQLTLAIIVPLAATAIVIALTLGAMQRRKAITTE
jgi:AAA family ATP:ADP antiporter